MVLLTFPHLSELSERMFPDWLFCFSGLQRNKDKNLKLSQIGNLTQPAFPWVGILTLGDCPWVTGFDMASVLEDRENLEIAAQRISTAFSRCFGVFSP